MGGPILQPWKALYNVNVLLQEYTEVQSMEQMRMKGAAEKVPTPHWKRGEKIYEVRISIEHLDYTFYALPTALVYKIVQSVFSPHLHLICLERGGCL